MQYLRLHPRLDNIQRKYRRPCYDSSKTTTQQHLHGCFAIGVVWRGPGLFGEFVGPEAV